MRAGSSSRTHHIMPATSGLTQNTQQTPIDNDVDFWNDTDTRRQRTRCYTFRRFNSEWDTSGKEHKFNLTQN